MRLHAALGLAGLLGGGVFEIFMWGQLMSLTRLCRYIYMSETEIERQ
jgi:hypothetical protein